MHIYPKNLGPISPETARPSQPADAPERAQVRPVAPVPGAAERSDKVEISDAGRALAARTDGTDSAGLDPARAARIRGRILSGAYDTLEVVDAVARRLLDTGDV
jgi:negative regulator of flagellin synthesis FlgM